MATKKKAARKKRKRSRAARPPFAARYPRDARLDHLVEAFEAGNFALVRTDAEALARSADDDDVRSAARDLRRRLDPEPTTVYLWALGVALLVFLFGYYLSHAR